MSTTYAGTPTVQPATNPWLVIVTLMVGTLAAVMGSSTINTALPDITAGLAITQDQMSWVATAYMLANVIAIPSAAWLGSLLSKRILFGLGVAVFMVGSVLCGVAWDFSSLIAFRVLQGLGAGVIMPTAQSLLFEVFPPDKRGMAMGIFGLGAIMGPALGPTVGGYLVQLFGWRSIFFINLPFGLVSLVLLGTLPRAPRRTDLVFDAPGFVSMVLFLSCLQIGVSNGAKDGWDAPYIVGCFVVSAVSFVYLIWRELTTAHPLLDLRVFKYPIYNLSTVVSLVVGLGLFGSTFLVPVILGSMLGYSALQIGLVLLPGSLVMGVAMLVAGRLSDLIDSRILLGLGLALFGYGLYMQALAGIDSPESYHAWAQFYRGLGMGLSFSPLSAVAIGGVPPAQIAQATGLFNLTRQLAGSIGIAALNTLLVTRSVHHSTMIGQAMSGQSEVTQRFLANARAMLIARGMAPDQATLGASSLLGNLVRQQVMVLAFADLFYICLAVVLFGLLPVLLLKPPRRRKGG